MQKPNNNPPLVSVLICAFNAEKFISETIRSVLRQSYTNLEVLILDNNSQDQTTSILNELAETDARIKLYENKSNLGAYPGLNYLLGKASGKYIAINDHDDIWHPLKIEKQITYLEEHAEYIGCGTAIINWYEKYHKLFYRSQDSRSDIAWHTSLVFRNYGYKYNVEIPVATDFHFMKNILSRGEKNIYNFQEPMVLRRVFQGQTNLSGSWMRGLKPNDILRVNIGLFDKAALLARTLLPREFVEMIALAVYRNNIPTQYNEYTVALSAEVT